MLSGIGNKTELAKVGIKPVVDLPDVGEHLQDHPMLANYFLVNSNATTDNISRNTTLFNATLQQWIETKTGQFTDSPATGLGFLRLPANSSIFQNASDPSAGKEPSGSGVWIIYCILI